MVPPEWNSHHFLSRICQTCTPQVSASHLYQKTTFTPCLVYPKIRYYTPANYPCWNLWPYWWNRHHMPPRNSGYPTVLWESRQHHHSCFPMHPWTSHQHPRQSAIHQPASKLLYQAPRFHHEFPKQQHVPKDPKVTISTCAKPNTAVAPEYTFTSVLLPHIPVKHLAPTPFSLLWMALFI